MKRTTGRSAASNWRRNHVCCAGPTYRAYPPALPVQHDASDGAGVEGVVRRRHSVNLDGLLPAIAAVHVMIAQHMMARAGEPTPNLEERPIPGMGLAEVSQLDDEVHPSPGHLAATKAANRSGPSGITSWWTSAIKPKRARRGVPAACSQSAHPNAAGRRAARSKKPRREMLSATLPGRPGPAWGTVAGDAALRPMFRRTLRRGVCAEACLAIISPHCLLSRGMSRGFGLGRHGARPAAKAGRTRVFGAAEGRRWAAPTCFRGVFCKP